MSDIPPSITESSTESSEPHINPPTNNEPAIETASNSSSKTRIAILLSVLVVVCLMVALAYLFLQNRQLQKQMSSNQITSYDGCLNSQGSVTTENGSTSCVTIDGRKFVKPKPEVDDPFTPPMSPTHMAQIQEDDGVVKYREPVLNYAFSYKVNPLYQGKDCSNGRYKLFIPESIPPNSDDPCGAHGVSGLGIYGYSSVNDAPKDSFCKRDENTSWPAELITQRVGDKDIQICKSKFVGERLYPGPEERWEVLFSQGNTYVTISLEDFQLTDLFYEILSTFEFASTSSETQAFNAIEAVKSRLLVQGIDLNKITIMEPQPHENGVYGVTWTDAVDPAGGSFALVGKLSGEVIVATQEHNKNEYCQFLELGNLIKDEGDKYFYGYDRCLQ